MCSLSSPQKPLRPTHSSRSSAIILLKMWSLRRGNSCWSEKNAMKYTTRKEQYRQDQAFGDKYRAISYAKLLPFLRVIASL